MEQNFKVSRQEFINSLLFKVAAQLNQ